MENQASSSYLNTADLIRKECIKAAIEAYETATQDGVCHEGAWECAIDAMRSIDLQEILKAKLNIDK